MGISNLLSGWVSRSRPLGCPQMTWGRTLENALKSKGISKEFDETRENRHSQGQVKVETAGSLYSQISWCLVAEGHLESKWLQLHYAERHLAQSDFFWRLHFSVAFCHSDVSLYLGKNYTGLD